MVHKTSLHLHLRVLHPEIHVPRVNLQRTLPHAAGAAVVILRHLPLRILDPHPIVPTTNSPDVVLELFSLRLAILGELLWVRQLERRRFEGGLDQCLGLPHELLDRDLRPRRGLILDRHGFVLVRRHGATPRLQVEQRSCWIQTSANAPVPSLGLNTAWRDRETPYGI